MSLNGKLRFSYTYIVEKRMKKMENNDPCSTLKNNKQNPAAIVGIPDRKLVL